MLKPTKGLALLAVIGTTLSLVATSSPSFAGTGGLNGPGIKFGEGSYYCEVANMAIAKVDRETGRQLSGAVFEVQADPGVGIKAGTYEQDSKNADVVDFYNPDRDLWQKTFNTTLDRLFAQTDFGKKWAAASVIQPGDEGTRVDSDGTDGNGGRGAPVVGSEVDIDNDGIPETMTDSNNDGIVDTAVNAGGTVVATSSNNGTTFTPVGQVFFPADITWLTNPTAQKAQMQAWPNWPSTADDPATADVNETTWSVQEYAKFLKSRLDVYGPLVWTGYDPNDMNTWLTNDSDMPLPDTIIFNDVEFGYTSGALDLYTETETLYSNLLAAINSAGYPQARPNNDGTINLGPFDATKQNFAAFNRSYGYATETWDNRVFFGIGPGDFPMIAHVVGPDAVAAANKAANDAVGATYVGDGRADGKVTLTTDEDGQVEYTVFGRNGDRIEGSSPRGRVIPQPIRERMPFEPKPSDCSNLRAVVTEVTAPQGYKLDPDSYPMVPGSIGLDEYIDTLVIPNDPIIPSKPGPEPESPQFESGR